MPPLLSRHHHHQLLLFLLSVAAFHGDASAAAYDSSMCLSESYTCGGVSFSYPFYRSSDRNDVDGNESSSCGYPGLGIVCDNDKPILQLDGVKNYTVKSIDGTRAHVSIADPEFVDGSCPRVEHNVTFAQGSWLAFPATTVDYIVFFLRCYFEFCLVPPPKIEPITCPDFTRIVTGSSFLLPNGSVPAGNWSRACGGIIQVPVLKYEPVDLNNNDSSSTWRNGGYGDVLRQGFQVSWDDRPAPCTQCEESNGRCAYNQIGAFVSCLCTNGQVNSDHCSGKVFGSQTTFPSFQSCRSS